MMDTPRDAYQSTELSKPTGLRVDVQALSEQRDIVWKLRWQRMQRVARRVGSRADLSIFGCYDGGNVGDLALGLTVDGIASRLVRTAFDSPKASRRLTPPRTAVLAGGGVITARPGSPLATFCSYVNRRPCAVAVVGVSATVRPDELDEVSLRTLRGAAWLSARSESSARVLGEVLDRPITVQPDIAFALRLSAGGFRQPPREPQRLLVNLSPFLHSRVGDHYVAHRAPTAWFAKHLPEQAAWYEQIGPRYVEAVRALLRVFVARGWRVASVPLAPEDDLFARSVLLGLPVEHLPYEPDPVRVVEHFATAGRALVTRFHAHVFALLAGTPLTSFAYSPKCSDLLAELGLPLAAQAEPRNWVHELDATVERLASSDAVAYLTPPALQAIESRAYDLTRRGVLAALDHD